MRHVIEVAGTPRSGAAAPFMSRARASRRVLEVALCLAALLSALPALVRAAPTGDAPCRICHVDAHVTRSDNSSVSVNGAALARSVHASLSCTSCHLGVSGDAHAQRLPEVRCARCHAAEARLLETSAHRAAHGQDGDGCRACHGTHDVRPATQMGGEACATCHAKEVGQYRGSVHGVALARGDNEASTCRDCHGSTHGVRLHTDPEAPVAHANLAGTCARCHADRQLMERRRITIPAAVQLYRASTHGRSKDPTAATCNDCHESHALKRANDPTSSIYRANIPATCGRCHVREGREYSEGVHGTALARGVTRSPVCTDCHGEHLIRGPHDRQSPVASSGISATCSNCHEAAGIRETFGLPAGRLSSYSESFHGLAARGGSPAVANCASCHGYHGIRRSSDPLSAVAPANLARTCGKCHPGASAKFAAGQVHVVAASRAQPVLYWVRFIYLSLIALTIGGMSLHQGLHFVRQVRLRFREQFAPDAGHAGAPRWFERMTVSERIQHALLALSFFTLVYTGFALKFPENGLFSWLARLEGGYSWRSVIHRAAAIVMVAVSVLHVFYLLTRRGRTLVRDLLPGFSDARDALENLLHLVGRRRHPPRFARFSYIEKAEYWALVWGTIVMTVTGFILWFENQSLRNLDLWVINAATLIHYFEAWLAFLAIVVWHLYQNIANPEVYPMNWTWLHGKISGEQLRHEHGGQWEEMQRAEAEAQAAREAQASGGDTMSEAGTGPGTNSGGDGEAGT